MELIRLKTLNEMNEDANKTHSYLFCMVCGREISKGREGYCVDQWLNVELCEYCTSSTFSFMQMNFSDDNGEKSRIRFRKAYDYMVNEQRIVAKLYLLNSRLRTQIRIRSRAEEVAE